LAEVHWSLSHIWMLNCFNGSYSLFWVCC